MDTKTQEFIKKAKAVHGDKYDYSKVEYKTNRIEICIICPKHGEFWQTPANHLRGRGCKKCAFEKISKIKTKTTEQFIKDARKIHGDRYDYSKVEYKNNETKVCIICPIHGEFWQNPNSHLSGCKCPKCANLEFPKKYNTKTFIEKAREIHGDKYDYSKTVFNGIMKNLIINCPIHGDFTQKAMIHLMGSGCQKCANNQKIDTDEFIKRSIEKHGGKYDYSKSKYKNNRTKIEIICHKKDDNGIEHGPFFTTPHSHMQGSGCPKCKQNYRLENEVRLLLTANNIEFEEKKTFEGMKYKLSLRPDFYLPNEKIIIECQGEGHFEPIDFGGKGKEWALKQLKLNKIRDEIKRKFCKENNVKLIEYTHLNIKDKNLIKTKENLLKEIKKYGNIRNKET